jgi:hypothetical protein
MDSVAIEFRNRKLSTTKRLGPRNSKHTLVYIERNCFSNCIMNMEDVQLLAGQPLEIVGGSLGLCVPEPVYYEWGGNCSRPNQTVKEFARCPLTGMRDIHYWFQTVDGLVWDVLDPYLDFVAHVHGKHILNRQELVHGHLIAGKSREQLEKEFGLMYLPASTLVQEVMVRKQISSEKTVCCLD